MSSPKTNPTAQPEIEKFRAWYSAEKEKGLVDVKFFVDGLDSNSSVEDFFGEVNRAITAEVIPDPELF